MTHTLFHSFAIILLVLQSTGCSRTWHQKFDWNAAQFFEDPQVIELCKAIEANDVAAIDRLVAAGVDVNTTGKGNMTPLLWAFPDNHFESFKRLLEHGANPNVIIDKNLIPPNSAWRGNDSVTHMVCRTVKEGYFEAVFENGGDVNLPGGDNKEPPITAIIKAGVGVTRRDSRIDKLIQLGANLDQKDRSHRTPAMNAVAYFRQFDVALRILAAGADPAVYKDFSKLAHSVLRQEKMISTAPDKTKENYAKLVAWLEAHGESLDEARIDRARWDVWIQKYEPKEAKKLFDREIADRIERETEQREVEEQNGQGKVTQ